MASEGRHVKSNVTRRVEIGDLLQIIRYDARRGLDAREQTIEPGVRILHHLAQRRCVLAGSLASTAA